MSNYFPCFLIPTFYPIVSYTKLGSQCWDPFQTFRRYVFAINFLWQITDILYIILHTSLGSVSRFFFLFFLLMFSSVTRNTPVFVGYNHQNPTITTQSRRWTFTSSHQHLQRESDRVYSLHTLRYKPNARTSFGQISRSLDDARYGNIFLSRPEIFLIQHSVPRVGTQFSNVSCRSKFNIEGNFTLL